MSGWAAAAMAAEKAFDTGFSIWSADRANRQARSNIRMQNEMQKHNFQHRYQWTMEDMKKAGLNPILAYSQGTGGGVGGVGTAGVAQVQPSSAKGTTKEALEYKLQDQMLSNAKSQQHLIDAEVNKKLAERNNLWEMNDILREEKTSAKAAATSDAMNEKILKQYPQLRYLDTFMKSLKGAGSAARSFAQ